MLRLDFLLFYKGYYFWVEQRGVCSTFYLLQKDQKAVRKKIASIRTAFYINDICYENACNSYKLLLPNRPCFCTDRCVSIDSNGSAGTVIRQLPVGNDGILFSRKLQNAAVSNQMKLC